MPDPKWLAEIEARANASTDAPRLVAMCRTLAVALRLSHGAASGEAYPEWEGKGGPVACMEEAYMVARAALAAYERGEVDAGKGEAR